LKQGVNSMKAHPERLRVVIQIEPASLLKSLYKLEKLIREGQRREGEVKREVENKGGSRTSPIGREPEWLCLKKKDRAVKGGDRECARNEPQTWSGTELD